MNAILIKNAHIVNEGTIKVQDVLIKGQRIERIDSHIEATPAMQIIDAKGKYL